jgi:hypothetical protein
MTINEKGWWTGMCSIYLFYYELENFFVDLETEQIVFDIYNLITPNDYFLFRYNPDKFCEFPWVMDRYITVRIIYVPKDEICGLNPNYRELIDINDLRDSYGRYEEYERQHMAVVGG